MQNSSLSPSELILNSDGSIYHLNLLPEQIAHTIITVGDPDRVDHVSSHFDSVEHTVFKREFKTHTGYYRGKKISVISTGIGTDNIDIVFNELDALVNIDFQNRKIKDTHTQLTFVRIGTSGAIQTHIPIDSFLISEKAIGFDNLLHFYENTNFLDQEFSEAFMKHTSWSKKKSAPYVVQADSVLLKKFSSKKWFLGVTATNVGFYGPQGRRLRLATDDSELNARINSFKFGNEQITNFEMETSGMYGLSKLLGHRAISLNAILANRANGTFSSQPEQTIDELIKHTLDIIAT